MKPASFLIPRTNHRSISSGDPSASLCVSFRPHFDWYTDSTTITNNKKAIPQSSTLKECNTNLETWKDFFFPLFLGLSLCQSVRRCCFLYRLAVAVVSGWGAWGAALAWRNSEAIFLTAAWEKAKASLAVFSLQFRTVCMYVRGKTSRYAFYWKETQRSILPRRSGTCWWGGINELTQKKKKEGATDVSAAASITRRFTCAIVGEDVFVRSIRKEKDVFWDERCHFIERLATILPTFCLSMEASVAFVESAVKVNILPNKFRPSWRSCHYFEIVVGAQIILARTSSGHKQPNEGLHSVPQP